VKPITIAFWIEDTFSSYFTYERGYLMDEKSAVYARLDKGDITLVNVVPTDKPGVYRDNSANVQLRDEHGPMTEDESREKIQKIYEMLTNMTAWEFCRDILCLNYGRGGTDLDLEGDK
jgi:hypothetical protein